MPEGGRLLIETANAEIAVGSPQAGDTLPQGRYVVLAVTDTGPALDEETRTRLFEPFFSSGRSGEDLPSIYTVIRDSGGDIHVTEGPEGGARYTIYLPAVRGVEPAPPPRAERPPVAAPEPTPTATVLLAEDEAGIRALVRKILQKQGYTVIEAASGEEALKAAETRRQPIDLLLTDVVMPGISGSELAEQMTAARPALKTLFMSGYTGDDLATLGPLPEGAAFLQKPFSLTALLDKVRSVLNS
jgi:CheY-like chemotaxis protein